MQDTKKTNSDTLLSSISVIFPAYNDEKSIPLLVKKVAQLLPSVARRHEVIIVNDGSVDNTKQVLDEIVKSMPRVKVVHHRKNKGYGKALLTGFGRASKKYIFYTDSDGQYDVLELPKLAEKMDIDTDMVTGYKLKRNDSFHRKIIGYLYNKGVRLFLGIKTRDIDCDFRLFRRTILKKLYIPVASGAFDAAFLKALEQKKARIKEVPIHHYKRIYGDSQFFTLRRVFESIWDVGRLWFLYKLR